MIENRVDGWGQQTYEPAPLTKRETDVVEILIRDGATNWEISRALFIDPHTVKLHISNAMRKLGAKNRTHLALIVCRMERE